MYSYVIKSEAGHERGGGVFEGVEVGVDTPMHTMLAQS